MPSSRPLADRQIAILVDTGFLDVEMTSPRQAIEDAGATAHLIAPMPNHSGDEVMVKSWHHGENGDDWGQQFKVDVPLDRAEADRYGGLLIPGGVMSPDRLRASDEALAFVRAFFEAGKPVAAICHGPWVLINAGVVEGRRMTSYKSIALDLQNAGADWTDEACVVDEGLVTSRGPDDLPQFNAKMIEEFVEGIHAGQRR